MQQGDTLFIAADRKPGFALQQPRRVKGSRSSLGGSRRGRNPFDVDSEACARFLGCCAARACAVLRPVSPAIKTAGRYRTAIAAFAVLATVAGAHAGDKGGHIGAPADIKTWIGGLADRNGANCCSDADGVRPQEVDWDMGKKHYRVRVHDRWIDVPDVAVVHGPNYLGHAVVWIYEELLLDDAGVDFPYVRCFLPGPAS